MLTDNAGRPLIPTAKISVGNLPQNGGGGCSNVVFSFANNADGNGLVSLEGQGLGTEIIVTGRVQLQFQFDAKYLPIGISFEEEQPGGREDRNRGRESTLHDSFGLNTFPERKLCSANGTTLLIVHDMHPPMKVEACFKFSLIIQNSDGKLIIIDPKIRNVPM